ncbi:MAG TPA: element excision factor XisH family protein [Saprospiraceae bacterium]|nr:element excision factor XisH family protein [Saprospiraceae bacterium]HRK80888.1 element excision factor XisH family protein [Saprospiraceae bacterium]
MAKDIIHKAVRFALEKDRWVITDDPFTLQTGDISVDIDLAAEKFLVAERGIEKILVEVKSFGNRSLIYDFHTALGQYIDYRGALRDEDIEIDLFLAISEETFRTFERTAFFLRRIRENNVKLLVVNLLTESIVLWQK